MAIKITENGKVHYENENDVNRELFPNEKSTNDLQAEIETINENLLTKADVIFSKQYANNVTATVTLERFHMYLVAIAHPSYSGGLYLISGYNTGNTRIVTIKEMSGITLSMNELELTIQIGASINAWVRVVDLCNDF